MWLKVSVLKGYCAILSGKGLLVLSSLHIQKPNTATGK